VLAVPRPATPSNRAPAAAAPADRDAGARQRIFRAAEQLFASNGFDRVSMRDITAEAGVNLAAVNYYYGARDALLLEIFRTRATELNRERALLLREATLDAATRPTVRAVLYALIAPATRWISDERRQSLQFLIRARAEGPPELRAIIRNDVAHLRGFIEALQRALPEQSRKEVIWRLHFALGVLHHNSAADYERLRTLSDGACNPDDRERLLERLLDFTSAGFEARPAG
jgi:AcrR family transcriptional regulator